MPPPPGAPPKAKAKATPKKRTPRRSQPHQRNLHLLTTGVLQYPLGKHRHDVRLMNRGAHLRHPPSAPPMPLAVPKAPMRPDDLRPELNRLALAGGLTTGSMIYPAPAICSSCPRNSCQQATETDTTAPPMPRTALPAPPNAKTGTQGAPNAKTCTQGTPNAENSGLNTGIGRLRG